MIRLRYAAGLCLLIGFAQAHAQTQPRPAATAEMQRWQAEAARVTITRDDWGIAHVRGRRDADAVFGAIYAQAEDDFSRIEANYLTALGRSAEAEGEAALWSDLRQRLFVDAEELKTQYGASPAWLRRLMDAWADGLNYYLATHPDTKPKVLRRFEPWMALSFTEGSIGGDIESISEAGLADFYGGTVVALSDEAAGRVPREPRGSNGIAIAPKNTVDGHALLLINPHTSFYFRSELHLQSGEGLNAYGASTWGQFFIYQGFNARAGWMHTSSGVDNIDEFAETVEVRNGRHDYRYGDSLRPMASKAVSIAVRRADGGLEQRRFTIWRTHHGPIVAKRDGKWIATALMWKPVAALEQSWLRTKTRDLASFLAVAARQANSSNDTIFADAKGEIAYLHPQFVPIRHDRFDYTKAVDGADPATDWQGLHAITSLPNAITPNTGWVRNTNDQPWSAAGPDSPKAADYPRYMDRFGENPRGVHADLLLKNRHDFTPEALIALAYDRYQPAFAALLPPLVAAYDALPKQDPRRSALSGPIALLRDWDYRWSATSAAQTLAVFWGDGLIAEHGERMKAEAMNPADYIAGRLSDDDRLAALGRAADKLKADFGSWNLAWGLVNRYQRLDDAISASFDDAKPSIPVPFASANWGSLASYGAHAYPNTKRYYGSNGNSFVAVVEFGPRLRAWAVTAGGASGDPASAHFSDQARRYAEGALRPVYFAHEDIEAHAVRDYHPCR